MNLMGPLGNGYFAFALNTSRKAAPLVERAGKIVLSNVPIEQFGLARQCGKHHRQESVNRDQLPFETKKSTVLGFPVPCLALHMREMDVEVVRSLGSHTLFVARIINEEQWAEGRHACMIHGIYKARRQRNALAV